MAHPRHLPPGRQPGPQSRRSRFDMPIALGILVLGAVGFIGGAIYMLVAAQTGDFDSTGAAVGASLFGTFGIGFAIGAWFLQRKRRPPQAEHLQVQLDREELRRGQEVRVSLSIASPQTVRGERVDLGLVCIERYDHEVRHHNPNGADTTSRETAEAVVHEEWRPVDHTSPLQSAQFTIPAAAPYSYEGDCISYAWRVSAREVRENAFDLRSDNPLWVLP